MQSSLNIGLAVQKVLIAKLDAIANNVANSSSPGFRSERIGFEELIVKAESQAVSFPLQSKVDLARDPGVIVRTENVLDVAIIGDGWFSLQTNAGQAYSRDGRLAVREDGVLTNLSGSPILDVGGATINVDPMGPALSIARDGSISQGPAQVGAIGLFRLDPRSDLTRGDGSSVHSAIEGTPIVEFVRDGVSQGAVEGSNVNSVVEMSRLIATQRLFEAVSGAIVASEGVFSEAIRMLGPSPR